MIKGVRTKGKGLHFSIHNLEQLCSCSQIAPKSPIMDQTRSEDVKPLLKPVLGWAQVGQQIHGNVTVSNTEYNNTQQFSLENSEETQNSTASFAKCYCWSTYFWIAITALTALFVKGDKLSILACRKRNSHRGDTCQNTDLITHMRLELKFHWWTKSSGVHLHESLLVTSWLQAVNCIFNDV